VAWASQEAFTHKPARHSRAREGGISMIRKIVGLILLNILIHGYHIYAAANIEIYNIQSIDGTSQKIFIEPNYIDNQLIITCLNDTLRISGFTDFDGRISALSNSFLGICYKVRAGSNIKLRRVLMLCVNHRRLYQALHITSLSSYDMDMVYNKRVDSLKLFDEHGLMFLKYNLSEGVKNEYRLNVYIHDEIKSRRNPKNNHNYNKQVALVFDANQSIFCSDNEDLSQYFIIYDPKTQRESKQYVMGRFPVIKLDKTNYYYIKGEWFEMVSDNKLLKYSFR